MSTQPECEQLKRERDEARAALDEMRMRTPPTGPSRQGSPSLVCSACGLHPFDFTAGEYEDELKRVESQRDEALAALKDEMQWNNPAQLLAAPLRTGRKVGKTLYLQLGPEPSDDDPLVGVMFTRALAERVAGER